MKKILKFIPLMILPLALSSCTLLFPKSENNNQQQTQSDTSVYPTSLTISGDDALIVGETIILTANFEPTNVTNKTITWTASNANVNVVKYGSNQAKISGKANGTVTITASMKGKNNTTVTASHDLTIGNPSATGIQMSSTSLSIGYNKTATLYAEVKPNKYANQAINWSVNNSKVTLSKSSTTSYKETITVTAGSSVGSAVITATSVDGNFQATCNVSVKEVVGTTVMIYMCGADLESENGLATSDLNEILSVNGQPDEVNIVVETGGANSWSKSGIPSNKLARWEIRNRQFLKKQELTYAGMNLSSTLQSFLEWGFENYASEKYGLILWNHGGGMGGVCFDERVNGGQDGLTADEVYDAVRLARNSKGITDKLEWITYDACLMAVQDIAEYNSYNFNYMLSSQESEVGTGYDYDAWLPSLYENPGIDGGELLEVIGHTFIQEINGYYGGNYHDQTQSVYDLSKIDAYKSAFESIASNLNSIIGTDSTKIASLGNLIASAKEYGCDEYGDSNGFVIYDAKDALNKVKANTTFSSISSKVTTFFNALDDLVIYEEHGSATIGSGICIYSPSTGGMPYVYGSRTYVKSNFTEWKKVSNKIFEELYDPYGY